VQRALIDDEISEKKAGLLLYSLQIAAANVAKTTFGQAAREDMVTEIEEEEAALERLEQQREKQKSKTLPLIHTDNTDKAGEEKQNIPRISADEHGLGLGGLQIRANHNDQTGDYGRILPEAAGGSSNEIPANMG